jgi:ATP-dependent DNA helicase RecG
MTLYGDLDVSVIDEMPKGRKPVITKKTYASRREKVWDFLESEVQKGRQAYVVYPLVEESEKIDLKNAVEEYEKLQKRFPDFKLGLIHGRLSFLEKQEVMSDFLEGKVQILVSTTVIEVGVDVANASLMVVEHAERFGLSQLHQLRGRVGRGEYKSYCVLILSGGFSEESLSRLSIMEKTSDGFKIAEADLEIRGPGEFLGTRQSGLPEFRMASLIRDGRLLQQAKDSALKVIKKDPHLEHPDHQLLKQQMEDFSNRFLPG